MASLSRLWRQQRPVFIAIGALVVLLIMVWSSTPSPSTYSSPTYHGVDAAPPSTGVFSRRDKEVVAEEDVILSDPTKIDLPNIQQDVLEEITRVIVLPGGGSSSDFGGYPEWTKQRVVAAYNFYNTLSKPEKRKTIFLTLSAGSFNAPNLLFDDKRTMFECQHMIQHLIRLGIERDRIYGDIFSWDTVTNGMTLRTFVDGLLLYFKNNRANHSQRLSIQVYISDFHAARAQASFQWVLGLEPSLLVRDVEMEVHSVSSHGVVWPSPEDYQKRIEHEKLGLQMVLKQAQQIKTLQEFNAFIMLGGHLGIRKYLNNEYVKSVGAGWHF